MKKTTLLFIFCFSVFLGFSQSKEWNLLANKGANFSQEELQFRKHFPSKSHIYSINYNAFKESVINSSARSNQVVKLPTTNGLQEFSITERSALAPALAARYPMIKSYVAQSITDKKLTARFSFGTDGLHAVIYSAGGKSFYVDPYTKDNNIYIAYNRESLTKTQSDFECMVEDNVKSKIQEAISVPRNADDETLRTYRIAIVAAGGYSEFHIANQGVATSASDADKKAAVLSAMNTSMTRINGVYERDLGVTMEIVANNDDVIFLDPSTDNITDGNAGTMINEVQTICDAEIGNANYDIGHIFSLGGSGLASLGVVCVSGSKARGVTGIASPIGDPYDIDYVAHEIGHQFGATHTQNNSCNRTASTAVEPGSASTIMGYAGICAPNVQSNSDDHFHSVSIEQMWNTVTTSATCAVQTDLGNSAPTANAGADFSIPKSTPFILKGAGSDADAENVLTYNWEQTDTEIATMPPVSTSTGGPAFRSNPSTISPNRYMPALATVVAGNISSTWEVVPSVARDMNFSLTVRDNNAGGGNTQRDDVVVSVVDVDPFVVNTPVAAATWDAATQETVTWSVGSSDLAPINSQLVTIKLSIDGGLTFPIILAQDTPNDGSEEITVPNNVTTNARIMVEASDNIFYNLNAGDFTIVSSVPSFILSDNSGLQNACNVDGSTASFEINVDFINGFSESTTLSASGNPSGSNVSFSPSVVTADGNVTMTVSDLLGISPQSYAITVTGTSPTVTQNIDVNLNILAGTYAINTLSSPADNLTNVDRFPSFSWSADANAVSYDIEIATDASFSNIVVSENSTTTSYVVTSPLGSLTEYFWRVRSKNPCGVGSFSTIFSFTTVPPAYCAAQFTQSNGSEWISKVVFNTIDNSSGNDHEPVADDGYEDFTSISTNIKRGVTHEVAVTLNTAGYQDHVYVFVDWNQDYIFDIATERYDLGTIFDADSDPGTTNFGTATLDITIPSDALLGSTRMRVIAEYDDINQDFGDGPCTDDFLTGWGEAEDYSVVVEEATASIEDFVFEGFNLYPNPTKGNFNLNFEVVNTDKVLVQLFDIQGRLVGEKSFFDTKTRFSENISFNEAVSGLYLIKISNGNKQTTRKLVLE